MDPSCDHRGDEWNLADCLRTLQKHKGTLAWSTLLGLLAAAALSAIQPREYQARASLEIQSFNDSFLELKDIYPATGSSADAVGFMQTQAEILQQDALLEQVGRKLGLEQRPEYQSRAGLAERLREDIRVAPVHNSHIMQIVSQASTPALASDLANTLAAAYIEQNIEARQAAAGQTYTSLVQQLDGMKHSLRLSEAGADPAHTPPGADVGRHFYDALVQKAYNAGLASRMRMSNIRLVGPATPPRLPEKPNLPLNLGIGTIGGLLLAVAGVMLREQRPVLRSPGDAASYLSLPELGAIPQARNWAPLAVFFSGPSNGGGAAVERAALEQRTELAESFRTIVASILSTGRKGGHPRVLVVTSSQPMEGKTTIVSNLGIALAAADKKVLLIDGDMRRPRLHKLFDQANSWGLSDVLSEKNAIDELPLDVLAKRTAFPQLHLLPSGASTDNVFGLLYSGRMSRLLPLFREEFDYVLVDAPPCLEFADARIMAKHAEEVLLVVRADYTNRRTAQAAVQLLRQDGIPVMGIILNRWDPAPGDPYTGRLSRSDAHRSFA
jgi:polysaccharide biosynthesis transport protein